MMVLEEGSGRNEDTRTYALEGICTYMYNLHWWGVLEPIIN